MRKRIQCKIIKSVPLDAGYARLRQSCGADFQHPTTGDTAFYTYTPRMAVTTCIDDGPPPRFLDCCA